MARRPFCESGGSGGQFARLHGCSAPPPSLERHIMMMVKFSVNCWSIFYGYLWIAGTTKLIIEEFYKEINNDLYNYLSNFCFCLVSVFLKRYVFFGWFLFWLICWFSLVQISDLVLNIIVQFVSIFWVSYLVWFGLVWVSGMVRFVYLVWFGYLDWLGI